MYPTRPLVMGDHRDSGAAIEELGYVISLDGEMYNRFNKKRKKTVVGGYDVWQVMYQKGLAKTRTLRCNIGVYSAWLEDRDTIGYNIHHVNHCVTDNHLFNLVKLDNRDHISYHMAFDRLSNKNQVILLKVFQYIGKLYFNKAYSISRIFGEEKSRDQILDLYKKFEKEIMRLIEAVMNNSASLDWLLYSLGCEVGEVKDGEFTQEQIDRFLKSYKEQTNDFKSKN